MLIDCEKRASTLAQTLVDVKAKRANDDHLIEYGRLAKMEEFNETALLPNESVRAESSSLQSQLKELANEQPHLKYFFRRVAPSQNEAQHLAPMAGDSFSGAPKAVDTRHVSKIAMSERARRSDFQQGLK